MNIMRSIPLIILAALFALAGCGGGGGGPAAPAGPAAAGVPTTVSGVASKGLIRNGAIKVYAVSADGTKGSLLRETGTDANGAYSADIGTYNGPVLVEASGNYTDEATGQLKSIPSGAPLRAAVGYAAGATAIAVTPLTELAVKRAEDPVSKKLTGIENANAQVAAIFKVDIVKTMPADASAAVPAVASAAQKGYGLALAAVSTMMQTSGNDVATQIAVLQAGIGSGNTLSAGVAGDFQTAVRDFALSNRNTTDIQDVTGTQLAKFSGNNLKLKLKLVGKLPNGGTAGGVQLTVKLPSAVTVNAAGGIVDATAAAASGVAAGNGIMVANYRPAAGELAGSLAMALVSANGFATGEFAFVVCNIATGKSVSASDFSIQELRVIDTAGRAAEMGVIVTLE
jgi:hypothetical protein